jgi:hypothetical protein
LDVLSGKRHDRDLVALPRSDAIAPYNTPVSSVVIRLQASARRDITEQRDERRRVALQTLSFL